MDRIDGLRAFVAVVDAGSFTRAGERLGISNKLVSKYVAAVERQQGITLLNRTTRSLSLTPAGERFTAAARRVLAAVEELHAQTHADRGALAGRLRITAPVSFGEMFAVTLTQDFVDRHPGVSLDLNLSDRYVDLAAEGFDLALRIGVLADSSLIGRRIGSTETWVVASPDYLARAPVPQHPDDLRAHRNIRDSNAAVATRASFVIDGQQVSVPLPGQITVNSAAALRQLALHGKGVAIIPRFMVAQDVAQGRLIRVLAQFPGPQLDIQALYLPQAFIPPRVTAYLDHLRQALAPQLAKAPLRDS
ncbi:MULTISPECIES: LysR family transcriptional regulator [unclassified Paracoccus (in: a-proteobacteria)]|uniref:LysR family transcriptional regulator n=1 Tax=unclassified Paracoccus (in: a-proteobacteria) TaxID=2688777 RepID=UPI0012B3043B|nr:MULTISPECIES: LysR family transcriptional regulator [unclassified Paracoccus (in: a-proteobacteria)]UXU74030.1 LysR family transcriptional regulator [Paracoccus sp. SMMA_5]UXU79919.1 LysR family transcriptional regulator [Paracoccus sp. SMMA_5_TC]